MNRPIGTLLLVFALTLAWAACNKPSEPPHKKLKVGMVLDTGGDNDRGFNEYSLKGAREAAEKAGIDFTYVASESTAMYERNIDKMIAQGADLIFTVGFALANATAKAAIRYPERHFAIIDYAYAPGSGCPETVQDCYTAEGGLANVTSLVFTEDQPAYLAGALAACMSKTGVIGSVAGYDIPPVVRFVEGFENGARSVRPDIVTHKRYIPDFNDADTGKVVAMDFISKGADVLFCAGGTTGLGALMAAKEAGLKAVGVDVDQYLTFPEAGSALLTSAMKNVDVAAKLTVTAFAQGLLNAGIQKFSLTNGAVGLAPFHDWQDKIAPACKEQVRLARQRVLKNPAITMAAGEPPAE
ncbi:MAG: BMP family ABC transporter substrate-binding protein [Desulfosarcinaceae bacterium]|jgi:basic membrane lipoprotein Med (substrate-binding protein (PBP1-ABC) superfamily)